MSKLSSDNKNKNQLMLGAMVILALITLVAPGWLEQKIVYQANVGELIQDSNGFFQTADFQLSSNQRYSVYLVYLKGFSIPPSFHSSTSSNFKPRDVLRDSSGRTVPNLMTMESSYGISTESAFKIAEFRYGSDTQNSLLLRLSKYLHGSLSDYKLVIRETRYASPMLLIFTDRIAFLFVVAFAAFLWFKQKLQD